MLVSVSAFFKSRNWNIFGNLKIKKIVSEFFESMQNVGIEYTKVSNRSDKGFDLFVI